MIDIAAARRGERVSLWAASAGLATLHSTSHVACRCSRERSWQPPGVHPVTSTLVRLTKILQHRTIPINSGAEKVAHTHRHHDCPCKVRASGACGHRLPGTHCRGSRTSGLLRRLLQRCRPDIFLHLSTHAEHGRALHDFLVWVPSYSATSRVPASVSLQRRACWTWC